MDSSPESSRVADAEPTCGSGLPSDDAGTEALLGLTDLAWFEVDQDRNVVAMSPAMSALTGFDEAEVLGGSCLVLNRCEECLRTCGVFVEGRVSDVPLRLFRKDGSEVFVEKSGVTLLREDGSIRGAIEVVRPIEDPPGLETPALDTVLAGLGRFVVLVDRDLRLVGTSPALRELVGQPAEALDGMPVEDLFGEDIFGADSHFRAAVERGERLEGWRAFLTDAHRQVRPVSISVGPIEPLEDSSVGAARFAIMVRPDEESTPIPSYSGIVAKSPSMQRIFRVVELLRDNDSTVLITGESGTGKELVARAVHERSHRSEGPFVAVNCAAIPPELLESELFGHARGSFTGAVKDRAGRFELADGGTVFLDEIGDLALGLQAKILRFLQERTLERVGESRTRSVDVRVIAATHVNLVQAVAERRFREDLYYRLRVVPIEIPPLRDRREDLELIIRHVLDTIGRERGRSLRLAPSASRALLAYPWPGNVRELQNALEFATTVCEGQTIHRADLPAEIGRPSGASLMANESEEDGEPRVQSAEVARIKRALAEARYRRARAAEILGWSRTTLWRKMKQYGL